MSENNYLEMVEQLQEDGTDDNTAENGNPEVSFTQNRQEKKSELTKNNYFRS